MGNDGDGHAFDFELSIERPHARDVDAIRQLAQRQHRARCIAEQRRPNHRDRLVRRERVSIVAEHHDLVPLDRPVGLVPVDDIDGTLDQRLILHRRQQRLDLGEVQAIHPAERGQSIGPSDKIRGETAAQA